eukprot:gene11868-biopygen9831
MAARNGHAGVVRLLMNASQHAAHANCRDGEALLLAARNGHVEVVRMLMNAPQHPAQDEYNVFDNEDDDDNGNADHYGEALLLAATYGHAELVQLLLNAPQHLARAGCRVGEALMLATQNGHVEVVCMLQEALEHAAAHIDDDDDDEEEDVIFPGALLDNKCAQGLTESYIDRRIGNASESGDVGVVRLLQEDQEHATHIECRRKEALVEAAEIGDVGAMRLLLNAPQQALADCEYAWVLEIAAICGHMLLDAPQLAARADCEDGGALFQAALNSHVEIVQMLLSAALHPAHADCMYGFALDRAAEFGCVEQSSPASGSKHPLGTYRDGKVRMFKYEVILSPGGTGGNRTSSRIIIVYRASLETKLDLASWSGLLASWKM